MSAPRNLFQLLLAIFDILIEISGILKRGLPENPSHIWLDTFEAMQEFHVTDRTLRRWKTENIIESRNLGGKVYYSKSSLEKVAEK